MAVQILFKSGALLNLEVEPITVEDSEGNQTLDFAPEGDEILVLDRAEVVAIVRKQPPEAQFLGR